MRRHHNKPTVTKQSSAVHAAITAVKFVVAATTGLQVLAGHTHGEEAGLRKRLEAPIKKALKTAACCRPILPNWLLEPKGLQSINV